MLNKVFIVLIAMAFGVVQNVSADHEGSLVLSGIGFGASGTKIPSHAICPEEMTPGFSWESAPEGTQAYNTHNDCHKQISSSLGF